MGVDIDIYVKAKDGRLQCADLLEYATEIDGDWITGQDDWDSVVLANDDDGRPVGATHKIHLLSRYYGSGYARGDWPTISRVLKDMLSDPMIDTVWYVADCYNEEEAAPVTSGQISATDKFYSMHGNRPYELIGYTFPDSDAEGCF